MNLKHGFHSKNPDINPDSRLLNADKLSSEDTLLAERFLLGDNCGEEHIRAHHIVKAIATSSRFRYPTLFDKAIKYAESEECYNFDRLLD